MANAADGTVVGGGDVISDEAVPLNVARGDNLVPPMGNAYKLPRSKLVVGDYGRDDGDVGPGHPLPVMPVPAQRNIDETAMLTARDVFARAQYTQGSEHTRSIFERGYSERGGR